MWQLHAADDVAALDDAKTLTGKILLSRPARGLEQIALRGTAISAAGLFRLSLTPPSDCETVQESYLRGNDLVITYQQLSERTVRPQIYWRALADDAQSACGVELQLSVQTDLLQSHPQAHVSSQVPARQAFYSQRDGSWQPVEQTADLQADVARPLLVIRGEGWSYVEMAFPGDFVRAQIRAEPQQFRSDWELFAEHLEKGVIRRARLRGLFVPPDNDLEVAASQFARFLDSPLPLTT
jgi:hypothetical protein